MRDAELIDQHLKIWLRSLPFLRSRNLRRDFADANLVAQLINFYMPKFVFENAYPPCMSVGKKVDNWTRLNSKVLTRLGLHVTEKTIKELATCNQETTKQFLLELAAMMYFINETEIKTAIVGMRK